MSRPDLAERVAEILDVDAAEFERQVADDAARIVELVDEGAFDNPQGIVGLEYEFYAVSDADADKWTESTGEDGGTLARVPRRLLEYVGFEKELGLHNAEMSTSPDPLNGYGLRAQEAEVCARLAAADGPMRTEGLALVSDGMWTIPPAGETARGYLTDSVEHEGIRIASNMSASLRYHAMSNATPRPGMAIDVPYASFQADTVLPESLTTSIQPHYQVPYARDLPEYFRYAVRIAGPLLALAVNSPFLPPDLYQADADHGAVLDEGWDEHRVAVFESTMNGVDHEKVRFPRDVATVEEAVDRVVADDLMVPMPVESGDRFDDQFAHFRHKHGTFWRWVRPVFGGPTRTDANARIEFRPLPGQPTVRDVIALQATYAGLVAGLYRHDHPVARLDWEVARGNFYAAAREGLDADLTWIANDGTETGDLGAIYDDVFAYAEAGLEAQGVPADQIDAYLGPLRARVEAGVTPASWKRDLARERLDRSGDLETAVHAAQTAYFGRQKETLLEGSFADWL